MSGASEQHRGIVAWWAQNSVAANLLMVVTFIMGVIGFTGLEREVFPSPKQNGAVVSILWPGASPSDVEDQIVTRIEEVMADLDGLEEMEGIASEGFGEVRLKAYEEVDINEFLDEVKLRVDRLNNLPQASFPPQVQRREFDQQFIGIALHGDVDRRTLKRVADEMRDELAKLEGAKLSVVWGTLGEEVSIEVSEDDLRRYNLTFSDVANAVRRSSLNSSGGEVRTEVGSIALNTRNLADTAEDFEQIVLRQLPTGEVIRVGDVATVIDGFVDADLNATYNGRPTTFLMVNDPETMDIVTYTQNVRDFMDRANEKLLPEAIRMDLLFDMSEVYQGRMNTISNSALIGTLLVLIVLILFLRPTVALWVTVGILTAFAGGFALLPLFGVSLNILSLFAVLLVIGVIVDDAIIVGENIHKQVESGERQGVDAAIVGTQLVVKPVMFGVITTMIMFGPWALLPGETRQFTQQITFVVIAALTFSLIESMLILPAHLAHMKPQQPKGWSAGLIRVQRAVADSLIWFAENIFKPVLELAIRFRYATVAFFFCLFWIAIQFLMTGILPFRFLPEIEDDLVFVRIELPDGTPFSRTEQVADQLFDGFQSGQKEIMDRYPEAESELIKDISLVVTQRQIQAWIGTLVPEKRPVGLSTKELADVIREGTGPIPDAEEVNFSFTLNEAGGGFRVALSHPNLDYLREAARSVKRQLATYDTAYDIGDNLSSAAPELRFSLKPGAEALGVSLSDVSLQVRQAYYGEEVQRLPRDGEDVRVMVRYPESERRSLDSVQNLRIRTADGREIPFNQVAEVTFAPGINRIYRRDQLRSVEVFSELNGDVLGQIEADMDESFWPKFEEDFPGIVRNKLGDSEAQQEFFFNLMVLNLGALGLMYVLLAIAFKSYFQPFLLMMAIPFSFAGAVFGHVFFGVPFAMFSLFGVAAAAGVVINDNLVLIDNVNRRRATGTGAVQALVESAVSRFRPILLTSVTTFVGVLPMIAERSVQAQFLQPMVVSLGSAVAFALFVSLFMVPALYAVGAEIARAFRWMYRGKPFQTIGETYDSDAVIGNTHTNDNPRPQPAE